ncbi:MAG: hypothetical protein HYU58_16285 [Proteobacteria bacterium]|nr:hypothetical protein [Pseudomonadota bacterium]
MTAEKEAQEKERYKAAGRIHKTAIEWRGSFLNRIAVIEHALADLLTRYFCTDDPSKQEIFFTSVAMKMPLEGKRAVLIEIVKGDYPRYWAKNKDFLTDLQKIQEFRNKLAHSILDVSEKALARPIEEGIGFVQWQAGKPMTEIEFNEWEVRANMALGTIKELEKLLPFKEAPLGNDD